MPGATVPSPDSGGLRRGRLTYLPVVPGRIEFAAHVRRALLDLRPRVVALELPATLREAWIEAVARLPQVSLIFYEDPARDSEGIFVPIEPADAFTEAVRTAIEIGAEVVFCDPDSGERPHLPDAYPDTYALRHIGAAPYIESYRVYPQPRSQELARHAGGIAWSLQGLDPLAETAVVISLNLLDPVLDAMDLPQDEPERRARREGLRLLNPHPDCLAEVTQEYPALQARYENSRTDGDVLQTERRRAQVSLLRLAEKEYEIETGEQVKHWQRRLIARYSRNLASANHDLVASLFDVTVAARGIVDDNYGWNVWEMANRYPWQQTECDLETVKISGDQVWLDTRRIHLRRRLPSTKRRMRPAGLKPRKKEKHPGEWAKDVSGDHICSYPPEDLVIEQYGRYLKKKGKNILSEERTRVEPFTTSLLDGVDLRETIRNWHQGKIFVREQQKVQGEVGSVVVIFDEDRDARYSYMTTWLGEHQNESDMAFYSTAPFDNMVGPGIGRGEYGGFLMSLPARRMFNVWEDPDYDFAESKPERLLLAGLDYSIQKYVVYVAAKPPRSIFRSIAARFDRIVLYIPIGQLSPVAIKKLRVVHVLDGYDKREQAKDFIW